MTRDPVNSPGDRAAPSVLRCPSGSRDPISVEKRQDWAGLQGASGSQEVEELGVDLPKGPGEGNGNPLQYSCLETSMDRGAWRASLWSHKVHLRFNLSKISLNAPGPVPTQGACASQLLTITEPVR